MKTSAKRGPDGRATCRCRAEWRAGVRIEESGDTGLRRAQAIPACPSCGEKYPLRFVADPEDDGLVMKEEGEIRGGIEYFRSEDGDTCEQCARCGSSIFFLDCDRCAGVGAESGYEEDPLWYDVDELYVCPDCDGSGGSWHCMSAREWCEAHPLPGREKIRSTALSQARGDDR